MAGGPHWQKYIKKNKTETLKRECKKTGVVKRELESLEEKQVGSAGFLGIAQAMAQAFDSLAQRDYSQTKQNIPFEYLEINKTNIPFPRK